MACAPERVADVARLVQVEDIGVRVPGVGVPVSKLHINKHHVTDTTTAKGDTIKYSIVYRRQYSTSINHILGKLFGVVAATGVRRRARLLDVQ